MNLMSGTHNYREEAHGLTIVSYLDAVGVKIIFQTFVAE